MAALLISGVAIVLLLASKLQFLSTLFLGYMVVGVGGIFVWFTLVDITVANYLLLSPFLFLRPAFELNLLYLLGLIVVFFIEKLNNHKLDKVFIPYPIIFFVLILAGVRSLFMGIRGELYLAFLVSEILLPFVAFIVILNSSFSKKQIDNLLYGHLLAAAFLGFVGTIIAIRNPGARIGSLWSNAMTINGYYVLAFFTGIGLMTGIEGKKKYFVFSLVILALLGMLFTYTRIVLVGVALGFFIMCIKYPRLLKYALMMAILMPFLMPPQMVERLQMAKAGDYSTLVRSMAWFYSWMMIMQKPIWGWGFDAFSVEYKSLMKIPQFYAIHSHNVYLRLWLEIGIIGLLSYLSLIGISLKHMWKHLKNKAGLSLEFMLFVAIITELAFCVTDVFILQKSVSIYFWLLIPIIIKLSNPEKQEIKTDVIPIDKERSL